MSPWVAAYIAARVPITVATSELPDASRQAWEPQVNFRQQQLARISRRHAQAFNQRPQGRTRIGSCCSGHVGGPTEWFCRVGGPEGFCFLTLPHHTGIGRTAQPHDSV